MGVGLTEMRRYDERRVIVTKKRNVSFQIQQLFLFSFTLSHFIEIEKGSYAQTSLHDGYFPRWQIGLSLACTSC